MRKTLLVVVFLFSTSSPNLAFAQSDANAPTIPQKPLSSDPRVIPGRVIAEGHNTAPAGATKLPTYKLEEVELAQPVEITVRGARERLTTVLRLAVTPGESQLGYRIWIDDVLLPSVWGVGAKSLATFIYDRSILRDGAIISVGTERNIYDLPERLKLPDSFRATLKPEAIEEGNGIVSISSFFRVAGSERQRFIGIAMKTAKPLPTMNMGYSVQIGRRFFDAGGRGINWSVQLTEQQFAELKDGDRVAMDVGVFNIAYLGRLDKSIIDR